MQTMNFHVLRASLVGACAVTSVDIQAETEVQGVINNDEQSRWELQELEVGTSSSLD
jgi:hypothetical protein